MFGSHAMNMGQQRVRPNFANNSVNMLDDIKKNIAANTEPV